MTTKTLFGAVAVIGVLGTVAGCGGNSSAATTAAAPKTHTAPAVTVTTDQMMLTMPKRMACRFIHSGEATGESPTDPRLVAAFAKYYDQMPVPGKPPAKAMYSAILAYCAAHKSAEQ